MEPQLAAALNTVSILKVLCGALFGSAAAVIAILLYIYFQDKQESKDRDNGLGQRITSMDAGLNTRVNELILSTDKQYHELAMKIEDANKLTNGLELVVSRDYVSRAEAQTNLARLENSIGKVIDGMAKLTDGFYAVQSELNNKKNRD